MGGICGCACLKANIVDPKSMVSIRAHSFSEEIKKLTSMLVGPARCMCNTLRTNKQRLDTTNIDSIPCIEGLAIGKKIKRKRKNHVREKKAVGEMNFLPK